jgi:hypothetical protein
VIHEAALTASRCDAACAQVTHLTENIKQAVTNMLSTAQHLESLDDRMRDRLQDIQSGAWRSSMRRMLLMLVWAHTHYRPLPGVATC